MEDIWQVETVEDEINSNQLAEKLRIPQKISNLLVQRNICTEEHALAFFQSKFKNIDSPFIMKDMENAVNRIFISIENNHKICILGDYDVDGTTGLAILYKELKKLNANVSYVLSNRISEGYGLNRSVLNRIIESKSKLLITVDCSISSNTEVAFAKEHNIDTIVCDHHSIINKNIECFAMLNPKQEDCTYPFKDLAGCGIALLLVMAMREKKNQELNADDELLQFAAIGTIADHVPLTGINRIITFLGLESINKKPIMMMKTLTSQIPLKGEISSKTILFTVAPRLNSPGRIHDASLTVKFLITEGEKESKVIANDVEEINKERRKLVNKAIYNLEDLIKNDVSINEKEFICLLNEKWHPGILAIISSFLSDKFSKPSFAFTEEHGTYKASIRSNSELDIFDFLNENKELLLEFGGHKYAAGLSLEIKNFELFKERLEVFFSNKSSKNEINKIIHIDSEINFDDINPRFVRLLKLFEPFGYKNKRPVFLSKNLKLINEPIILQNRHLKFKLRQNLIEFEAIAFNKKHLITDLIENRNNLSLAYYLSENRWLDKQNIQLEVVGLK